MILYNTKIDVVSVVLVRMLVYEYVDNGNLEQWLHGDVGPVSPLTWDDRMKIILGTAKGYVCRQLILVGLLSFTGTLLNYLNFYPHVG